MVLNIHKNHLCGDLLDAQFWDPPQRFEFSRNLYFSKCARGYHSLMTLSYSLGIYRFKISGTHSEKKHTA